MPELQWNAGIIIGIQTAYGTINDTIRDDTGAIGETDGLVLGNKDFGTGESGITLPTHTREAIEKPDVASSFTQTANAFVRENATGLQIVTDLKGNGNPPTPVVDEARPVAGIDAILRAAGLTGSTVTGGEPDYQYKPAPTPEYATIKLFMSNNVSGLEFAAVYQDCMVESLEFGQEGGESPLMTSTWRLGSVAQVQAEAYPTFTYGNQATLSPPIVKAAAFTYGTARCFQTLPIVISNSVNEYSCSNNTSNGKRLDLSERRITANGSLLMDDADVLMEYDELVRIDASFATATWNYGDGDEAATGYNQLYFDCNQLLVDSLSWDRSGSLMSAEIETHCIATTAGGEFTLTFS